MKEVLKIILLILGRGHVRALEHAHELVGVTGIIYEILGPAVYEKMLIKLKISWSFERIWNFMFVCLVILIITYFIRKKFFLNIKFSLFG